MKNRFFAPLFLATLIQTLSTGGLLHADPQDKKPLKIPESTSLILDGTTLEMKGDFKGAIQNYSKAIEKDPANIHGYLARGRCLRLMKDEEAGMKDINQALELVQKGLEKNPKDAQMYYLRGHAKRILKQWDGAIQDTEKAIELDPKRFTWPTDLKAIRLEQKYDKKK